MSCKLWISKLQCSLLGHLPAPETGRVMEAVIAPNGVTAGRTIEWEKSPPSLWFIHPSLLCPPFISRSLSKWSWRTVFERGGQTFVDNLNALYNICSCIKTVACRPAGHAQCPISRPLPLLLLLLLAALRVGCLTGDCQHRPTHSCLARGNGERARTGRTAATHRLEVKIILLPAHFFLLEVAFSLRVFLVSLSFTHLKQDERVFPLTAGGRIREKW